MRGTQPTQAAVVARGEGGLLRLRLAHLPLALLLHFFVEGRALREFVLGFFDALEELLALIRASRVGPEVDCAGTWKNRGRRRRRRRRRRRHRRRRRRRRARGRLCVARPDQVPVVAAARAGGAVGAQLCGGAEPRAGVAADGRGLDEGLELVAAAHQWPVRLGPHVAAVVLVPPAAQIRVGAAAHLVLLARICPPRGLRADPGPAALDLAARRRGRRGRRRGGRRRRLAAGAGDAALAADPLTSVRNARVNAREVGVGAAVAPAHDAREHVVAVGVDAEEGATRVALARVLAAIRGVAGADHRVVNVLITVGSVAVLILDHRHVDLHGLRRGPAAGGHGAPAGDGEHGEVLLEGRVHARAVEQVDGRIVAGHRRGELEQRDVVAGGHVGVVLVVQDLRHLVQGDARVGVHVGDDVHADGHAADCALRAVRGGEHPIGRDERAAAEVEAAVGLERDEPGVLARRVDGHAADNLGGNDGLGCDRRGGDAVVRQRRRRRGRWGGGEGEGLAAGGSGVERERIARTLPQVAVPAVAVRVVHVERALAGRRGQGAGVVPPSTANRRAAARQVPRHLVRPAAATHGDLGLDWGGRWSERWGRRGRRRDRHEARDEVHVPAPWVTVVEAVVGAALPVALA